MAIFKCGQKIKVVFDPSKKFDYFNYEDYKRLEVFKDLTVLDDCNKFFVAKQTGAINIIWIQVVTNKGILKLDRSLPYLISKFNIEYGEFETIIYSGRYWGVVHEGLIPSSGSLKFGQENYISGIYLEDAFDKEGIPVDFDLPLHIWNKNEDLITVAINKGFENYGKIHS